MKKFILLITIFFSSAVMADDLGCKLIICFGDPRGAVTEKECAEAIKELNKRLMHGKPFPGCELSGNRSKKQGSYIVPTFDYYDLCPDGTTATAGYIVQSESKKLRDWLSLTPEYSTMDGRDIAPGGNYARRACTSGYIGRFSPETDGPTITVFSNVIWQERQPPEVYDLYIDGKLYQRQRVER